MASSGQYYEFRSDTPESARARRKMLDAMLEQATTYKPLGHWSAAAAQGLQGIFGGLMLRDLEEKEKATREAGVESVNEAYGGVPKSTPPQTEAAGGGGTGTLAPPAVTPRPLTPPAPRAPDSGEMASGAPRAAPVVPPVDQTVRPYNWVGPIVRGVEGTDRGYGRHAIMGRMIPSVTREVLGKEMTPQEFLANPEAQDAVAKAKPPQGASLVAQTQPAAPQVPAAPIAATGAAPTGGERSPLAPPVGTPTAQQLAGDASRAPAPRPLTDFIAQAGNESPTMRAWHAIATGRTRADDDSVKRAREMIMNRALELQKADTPLTPEERIARAKDVTGIEKTAAETQKLKAEMPQTSEEQEASLKATIAGARKISELPGFDSAVRLAGYSVPLGVNAGQFGSFGGDLMSAPKSLVRAASPDHPAWAVVDQMQATAKRLSLAAQRVYLKGQGQVTENERQAVTDAIGALERPTSPIDWKFKLNSATKMIVDLNAGKRLDQGDYTTQPTTAEIQSTIDTSRGTFDTKAVQALAEKYGVNGKEMQDYIVGLTRPKDKSSGFPDSTMGSNMTPAGAAPAGYPAIDRARKGDFDRDKLRRVMLGFERGPGF